MLLLILSLPGIKNELKVLLCQIVDVLPFI
jgi:hypothetical protein